MSTPMALPKALKVPEIAPIAPTDRRPLWSVMITTYRRTTYLAQAIQSVLDQGFSADEMQIEVVDDCSPNEDIEALVKAVGQGRVTFYRQPVNVGIYENWNTCIRRAQGCWVHILSDDDLVMPGFYEVYREHLETDQGLFAIGQSIFINEHDQWIGMTETLQVGGGILPNALPLLSAQNPIRTPAIVVAREAYEKVGGFTSDLIFTPDWEMWTRLAATVKTVYINRPYSLFRMHSHSETSQLILTGAAVTDALAAAKIIQTRFAERQERDKIHTAIKQWLSINSRNLSHQLIAKSHYQPALLHATWSFRLTPSLSSGKNLGSVWLKVLQSRVWNLITNPTLASNSSHE